MKQNLWGFAIVIIIIASIPFRKRSVLSSQRLTGHQQESNAPSEKNLLHAASKSRELIKIREQKKNGRCRTVYLDSIISSKRSRYYLIEKDSLGSILRTIQFVCEAPIQDKVDLFTIDEDAVDCNCIENGEEMVIDEPSLSASVSINN